MALWDVGEVFAQCAWLCVCVCTWVGGMIVVHVCMGVVCVRGCGMCVHGCGGCLCMCMAVVCVCMGVACVYGEGDPERFSESHMWRRGKIEETR